MAAPIGWLHAGVSFGVAAYLVTQLLREAPVGRVRAAVIGVAIGAALDGVGAGFALDPDIVLVLDLLSSVLIFGGLALVIRGFERGTHLSRPSIPGQ